MSSYLRDLVCARCSESHDPGVLQNRCSCGGTLQARYRVSNRPLANVRRRPPTMWRYRELSPLGKDPISFVEPQTPLLPVPRLSERWGIEVWLKDESPLPGGTFKARGAAVGLSRAVELGAQALVMPSAGNAGGAWALYAARAGIPLTVTMSRKAPASNQREVEMTGAKLVLVDGTIADAGALATDISKETGAFLCSTFTEPYRVEGKKTAWLEVFDALGGDDRMRAPATVVLPVGGGVAAVAASKAYQEALAQGWMDDPMPQLVGVQSEMCAPIVEAFHHRIARPEPWEGPSETVAAGLRVPAPSEGDLVLAEVRASGGSMMAVSDESIVAAVKGLAAAEGVFACPEGAATVAAADLLARDGRLIGPVVLYNTGAGTKYLELLFKS